MELYKGRGSACQQALGVIEKSSPWDKDSARIETNSNTIEKNSYVVKEDGLHLNVLNTQFRKLPH